MSQPVYQILKWKTCSCAGLQRIAIPVSAWTAAFSTHMACGVLQHQVQNRNTNNIHTLMPCFASPQKCLPRWKYFFSWSCWLSGLQFLDEDGHDCTIPKLLEVWAKQMWAVAYKTLIALMPCALVQSRMACCGGKKPISDLVPRSYYCFEYPHSSKNFLWLWSSFHIAILSL